MSAAVDILREFRALVVQERNQPVAAEALGDSNIFAEKFTKFPRQNFHRAWVRWLSDQPQGVLLAPRDHGKTMTVTVIEAAHRVLQDRDLRVLVCSGSREQAVRMGRAIRRLLESVPVRTVFGDVRGEKWTDTELLLSGSALSEKEASITMISAGGSITSGHYDLVILDDIIDFENTRTQPQRDKTFDWFRFTLLPVCSRGQLWIIGTRYHWDDLYGRLQDSKNWPRTIPIKIERAISTDAAGVKKSLWESQYTLKKLEQVRAQLGTIIFNAQYQNDADAMKGSIFKAEWLKRFENLPALPRYQGVDLAIGKKSGSDYFAVVTVSSEKNGNIYVLGSRRGRLSFDEQYREIKNQHDYYHRPGSPVVKIGIEVNQYQDALAQRLIERTRLPIRRIHQTKDKLARAMRLSALFENGKIFFPVQGTEDLEEELLLFPEGAHDDLFDALEMAVSMAGHGRRPASITRKPRGM